MNKLLSIIVPAYNMEQYLPKCLGSLVDLGDDCLAKLDVIVANDGSKDRTSEIAHDFARRYPQVIRVIDKQNGHYGSAINAGLAVAVGLYVKNLDADDTFDADALAALLAQIERDSAAGKNVDLYLTAYDHVNEHGDAICSIAYDLPSDRAFGVDTILAQTTSVSMHAFTWRTGLLKDMGYRQSEKVHYSDWEWILYPMLRANVIRYLPVRVYRYLLGREGQSISLTERRKNFGAWQVLLERAFTVCRTQSAELTDAARLYLFRVTIGMAEMYAETVFLMNPIGELKVTLSRFLAELERVHGGFVAQLEDVARVMKRSLNVPYLRIWHRLPIGKTVWVMAVRGYLSGVRWVKSRGKRA